MRYLGEKCPAFTKVLLIESGSRSITELALPRLQRVFGDQVEIHLLTCFAGAPAGMAASSPIWRTQDYGSSDGRRLLLNQLRATGYEGVAIVCSGESIMLRWKWWTAWSLPSKVLIVNENADAFWLDRTNHRVVRQMLSQRMGIRGGVGAGLVARLFTLPFVVLYLLLYATITHARRAIRLAFAPRAT